MSASRSPQALPSPSLPPDVEVQAFRMSAIELISTYGTVALPAGTTNRACPVEMSTKLFTVAKASIRPAVFVLLAPRY